jgi:Bacterial Ig-like domain (group 3)/Chitobiase/beta-hexosaminidase C-terminal domain/FG-GAP-like repeat
MSNPYSAHSSVSIPSILPLRRVPARSRFAARLLLFLAILATSLTRAWAAASPTTTSLIVTSAGSAVTSVAAGTVLTLTATVVSGTTKVNPGQVKFCNASAKYCEDSALLATAQLTSAGVATYKLRPGPGSYSYQAVFVGTKSYAMSSSTKAALTVTGKYPTATTIAPSGSVGNYTLTAMVTSADKISAPTGDVSFLDTTNGNALLGTGALGSATLEESFPATSAYSVGHIPLGIAAGDFNEDGIPDLASTNLGDGTVTIALGNGDGTFTSRSTHYLGSNPAGLAVGDFNGDGIPDLAVANYSGNTVTVLLGNGDGTFALKSSPTVGNGPNSVVAGDFNGDGILDLVTTNFNDNTVTVLLGNGDGTFTIGSTASVGPFPYSVVVSDFNGDGIPDLATVVNTHSVTLLMGNGDGTFTTKGTLGVGFGQASLAVGDFNGDGIPDLALANETANTITVLLGNGDWTFTLEPWITGGGLNLLLAVGDFNGDGIQDLVTSNGHSTVTVLSGNGDGTFSTGATMTIGNAPDGIAVGDFNGDGFPDVALLGESVTIFLNQFAMSTATLGSVSVSDGGTHQVEASYPGDANANPSISGTIPLLAEPVVTALSLTSSLNPSVYGSSVTLTATLTPYSFETFTTNGETVTFYDGGTAIGNATFTSGVATINLSTLPFGANTLTAKYVSDGNFAAATSNAVAQMVVSSLPVFSPLSGTYTSPQMVTITNALPGATIYYTTDGTVPSRSSKVFNPATPIAVSSTQTIKAYAVAPGYALSPQGAASYKIIPPYAPTPTFSLAEGFYNSSVMVSIMDSLAGATIHYTTDHTIPTASSPMYSGGPITINSTERLQAIAVAPNYSPSAVAQSDYYIATAEPVISLPSGNYISPQTVTITDSTPGAVIYYTTNGTVPNRASPTISSGGSITVSASETLKAIAVAAGYTASPQAAAWYTITP